MSIEKSEDHHNYTEAVATRLTPQQAERFEAWRDDNELATTAALRQAISTGLEAESSDKELVYSDGVVSRETLRLTSFVAAVAFVLLSLFGTGRLGPYVIGGTYIGGMLLWAHWPILKRTADRFTR